MSGKRLDDSTMYMHYMSGDVGSYKDWCDNCDKGEVDEAITADCLIEVRHVSSCMQ